MIKQKINNIFKPYFPEVLIDELITCYLELKQHYYCQEHRPSELDGGRFSEVVIRMIQHVIDGKYIQLGTKLPNVNKVLLDFEMVDGSKYYESMRIHIPRVLNSVYNIRNRRDVGHIGKDISANENDSNYVFIACTWILVELIRIYSEKTIEEAKQMVSKLVEIELPIIQNFDDAIKILKTDLPISEKILLILFIKQGEYLNDKTIMKHIEYNNEHYIVKRLIQLSKDGFIHRTDKSLNIITKKGIKFVIDNIDFSF